MRAFDFIKKLGKCYMMIGDFTHFFDNLDHGYLRKQWCFLLQEPLLSPEAAYFCGQGGHVGAVERRSQSRHLIKDAACSPDISLLPIRLTLQHLGAELK